MSDDELVRRWKDESIDDDGETFIAIYSRYRDLVRRELERTGLSALEAETRIGTVFIKALDTQGSGPIDKPLEARLLEWAREVGKSPALNQF